MTVDIVVADDLTGAADTVVQFVCGAGRTLVYPSLHAFEDMCATRTLPATNLALAVSTESRHLTPVAAARRVLLAHRAALQLRPRLLFQKIDSAMRGNPAAEVAAYRQILGSRHVLMTPAFFPSGRVIVGGTLFVHGVPRAQSQVASDARSPAGESSVLRLMNVSSRTAVSHLPLDLLRGESANLGAVISRLPDGIIVADAETEADLQRLARLVADVDLWRAVSGSAGLAAALRPGLYGSLPQGPGHSHLPATRVLYVIGSPHETARAQLAHLAAERSRTVTEIASAAGQWLPSAAAVGVLASELEDAGLALLGSPPLDGRRPAAPPPAEAVARRLAAVARNLVVAGHADGLVVCGGDVAAAVCAALRVESIELQGQVFPGAPIGVIRGGPAEGVRVVTKSGAHGDATALLTIDEALRSGLTG